MTVGEALKKLVMAENYVQVRMTISDEFINFIKDVLPSDYEYIEEKENNYQEMLTLLKENNILSIITNLNLISLPSFFIL